MLRASLFSAIAFVGFTTASFAQAPLDELPGQPARPGSGGRSVLTGLTQPASPTGFTDRRFQKRYEKILSQLEDMKPSDSSEPELSDWFVVGGALIDKRTGQSLVRFNKVQGAELLAYELVKFLYAPRGNASIGWRIFDRTKEETAADQQLVSIQTEYRKWEAEQTRLQQERVAKYRSQLAARNARAGSFFSGYSRGRFCAPGRG